MLLEWEDVKEPASEPVTSYLATASAQTIETHSPEREPTAVGDAIGLEREDISFDQESSNESVRQNANRKESDDLSDSETDEERGDDMMLTLKSEIEDAKAEEDLNLLKEEALHSAMVTASNLT